MAGESAPNPLVAVALYTAARVGLVAVITGLLVLAGVPLLVALVVAIVVALPLSLVAFPGLNRRVSAALADVRRRRAERRVELRARLRGDVPPAAESGEQAEREPDAGGEGPGEQQQPGVPQHPNQAPSGGSTPHPPDR